MMTKQRALNGLIILLLLLLTARFAAMAWDRLPKNANSADGDHGAYLQLGLDLREHGLLTDGKRPPLYPMLLAPFAQRDWAYFTWAKIANLIIGAATLGVLFEVGRRLFGWPAGLLAALLLSVNMEFILHSTFALAESLLMLTFLLAWFFMVRALQQPARLGMWIAAGVFTALAFLAKGTGPIIALCFMLTATILLTPRVWLSRGMWAFIISAGLVTAPLWLYNWVNFGSPLFNSAINNVMWMDDAGEKYVAEAEAMPTLTTFLQEKNPAELWDRLSSGLVQMRYFYLKLLWPTRSTYMDEFFAAGYFDLLVLSGLILAGLIGWFQPHRLKEHRHSLLLTAILVAAFYVLFAWYMAIAPYPIRFLLPLGPILYLMLAAGAIGLGQWFFTGPRLPTWGKALAAAGLIYLLLYPLGYLGYTTWALARAPLVDPFPSDAEFNQYRAEPIAWAALGHSPAAGPVTVMWGPSHNLPVWRFSDALNLIRTPAAQLPDAAALQQFLEHADVAYIIVDTDMLDRIDAVGPAVGLQTAPGERVQLGNVPSDWALGYVRPDILCETCVFRRITASPPLTPANYRLGQAIDLIGYELDDSQFHPSGQLVVNLYWQSHQPTPANYTIFSQLLGPDFQLHGQLDRQPLSGSWPTSRWQPGQKFMDKFVIPVDEAAPAGDYTLLIGMYDLATGQRAAAAQNGQPVPDNAIRLHQLSLSTPAP